MADETEYALLIEQHEEYKQQGLEYKTSVQENPALQLVLGYSVECQLRPIQSGLELNYNMSARLRQNVEFVCSLSSVRQFHARTYLMKMRP